MPVGSSGIVPDIDFQRIRPYGLPATRANGFEELASILIEDGVVNWPDGVRFERFGNPDGGREGRGILPNGDVWAWQAKFLFEFDSSAAGQVTESVRRVLNSEQNLKRYFVALPIDLPAGDTEDRTSAHTRWTTKVADWEASARNEGRDVRFEFVGMHELLSALTATQNAGRARYWFDARVLTPEWLSRRLTDVIAKVGHRYSPNLHVEIDAVRALDAVGRTEAYVRSWQAVLAQLREARRGAWRPPADVSEQFGDAVLKCTTALDDADSALLTVVEWARSAGELPAVDRLLDRAAETLSRVDDLLHEHSLTSDRYFVGDAAFLYSSARRAREAVEQAREMLRSVGTKAARRRALLLTGRAGVGKTHLLCDVAARRIAAGLPTVVLLGQDFDARSLIPQISEQSQLGPALDDVLAVLDAASEATGCIGLLMIDAINESESPERWRPDARAIRTAAARYPNVALVLSCRTEFLAAVVGDSKDLPRMDHLGFAEATDEAIVRFTREYGLEAPTFPVLSPEFGNPLFLKLTCEALSTLGATRFQFGSAGLSTVCAAFLEAVNERLSESSRCDYDVRSDPVKAVVRRLSDFGTATFGRQDVTRITGEELPGRSWSHSLMRGLISEGVLVEIGDEGIAFGYQRLGDVERALTIADRPVDEIRTWLRGLGDNIWCEQGVLAALAVILPEQHPTELVDLGADEEGRVRYELIDCFLQGLVLRSPGSVSERTRTIVQGLMDIGHDIGGIWDSLICVACIPEHPLNAEWFHSYLAKREVAERDVSWSLWLARAAEDDSDSSVRRLLNWAWPHNLASVHAIPDEVVSLATRLLGWLLTASDRRVRDRATKALVCLAQSSPTVFGRTLATFKGTNDPYVVERLAGAACGVVLRLDSAEAVEAVASGVRELVRDAWPEHLVTRDYIRRVFDAARMRGWSGAAAKPPYGAKWPVVTRSAAEIEALAGPPDYLYGSIWHSLTGMGDFGRYVLQPLLRQVLTDDPEAMRQTAERAVFERTCTLGWTPERFGEADRRWSGRDSIVERIGKKYQWIGLYEVLGRITDNYWVKPHLAEANEAEPYAYAEQLVWRDIDPTVLVRKPDGSPKGCRPWFSPVEAVFPQQASGHQYPDDMAGVPDPLDLIEAQDDSGTANLVLLSQPVWRESLPPEVEALEAPLLEVWMHLHAYLIPVDHAPQVLDWATGKDWFGRWMPEVLQAHTVLLGAHPDDPEWSAAGGWVEQWDARRGPAPCDLLHTGAWYGGTGASRDASAESETQGYVPSRDLFRILGAPRGVDFAWRDGNGVAIQDPSVITGGPASLVMRRDLAARLADAGLTLFWTILVGKELLDRSGRIPDDDHRWISASASYMLNGDRINQIGVMANCWRAGPQIDRQLEWSPRKT